MTLAECIICSILCFLVSVHALYHMVSYKILKGEGYILLIAVRSHLVCHMQYSQCLHGIN